jgi:hypothetical protein
MVAQNPEYIWNFVKSFQAAEDKPGTATPFVKSNKLKQIDRKLARAFLECARMDINASKLLYREKDYSNAVYHLQQATEKLAKAYFMLFPSSSYDEIRAIQHTTPRVFLDFMSKSQAKPLIYRLKSLLPSIDFGDLDEILDIVKIIKKPQTQVEMARLSNEEIKEFLKIPDSISPSKGENGFEVILRNLGTTVEEIEEVVQKEAQSENVSAQALTGPSLKKMINDAGNYMIGLMYFFLTLYVLAVITFPHERFTRYPDEEVKPAEYAKSLGIVTEFEEVVCRLEEVFKHTQSDLLSDDLEHRKTSKRMT